MLGIAVGCAEGAGVGGAVGAAVGFLVGDALTVQMAKTNKDSRRKMELALQLEGLRGSSIVKNMTFKKISLQ